MWMPDLLLEPGHQFTIFVFGTVAGDTMTNWRTIVEYLDTSALAPPIEHVAISEWRDDMEHELERVRHNT
jgi:hypothetical protein